MKIHLYRKKISAFLFPFIALIILVTALSRQIIVIPPLGKLLNPFTGVAQNDQDNELESAKLILPASLENDSVAVYFDVRKVPHIYASNPSDLYFAQGYVTAAMRLWQMDFLAKASAGQLAEIIDNESFLSYDRSQRRLGILEAAKSSLAYMEKDSLTMIALNAYTRGVNLYIKRMTYKGLPFEYKLLDYYPEPWTNLKSVLIMKALGNTLSGYEEDMFSSKMMLAFGEKKYNALFPEFTSRMVPVVRKDYNHLKSLIKVRKPLYLNYSFITSDSILPSSYNPKLGSNSWVVSGGKTKSGYPILANDPHLNLSLPAFWLEMQLNTPEGSVYGVTIPGTPAIIIGFNKNIAWGITNGADDVKDWYKLKLTKDYTRYLLNNKWEKLNYRIEKITRRSNPVYYDTVYETVNGPIVYDNKFNADKPELINFSMKWELLNPSNEFKTFIMLNNAKNYSEYRRAIKGYSCPSLNFTFAANDNTIAVNHQGKLISKSFEMRKFIQDGTNDNNTQTSYIPSDSLPMDVNPLNGYIVSANQRPTTASYPYLFPGYYSEQRALRIDALLKEAGNLDIKLMQRMQLDNTSSFADEMVDLLIKSLNAHQLNDTQRKLLLGLSEWHGSFNMDRKYARLYVLWLDLIKKNTWDEFKLNKTNSRFPSDYTLFDLIAKDRNNEFFDKQGTSVKENANDIITASFLSAANQYLRLHATHMEKWGSYNKLAIMHLTNIPAFSDTGIKSSGHPEVINAAHLSWGPTWRMIVELGPNPKGYGIYPGGQSGNIGSRYFNNFTKNWINGKYFKLLFFKNSEEAKKQSSAIWILKKDENSKYEKK